MPSLAAEKGIWMRILVDDRECSALAENVGQALAAAADAAERDGRRVVDVSVDGQIWGDLEFSDALKLASAADEVRCTTACPGALLRETFLGAAEALVEAEELQRKAARSMQADDGRAGMNTLTDALSLWMNIQKAASQGIAFGQIDPRDVTTREGTFEDAARDLTERLSALRNAMQNGDIVAVCDCLLYEFPLTTRRWAAVLAELTRRADLLVAARVVETTASRTTL